MLYLLDTANLDSIRTCCEYFPVAGVTTNPTIISREKDNFLEIITGIRAVNPEAAILMQTLYNPRTGYVGEVYQHGSDRINEAVNRFNEEHPGEIAIVDVAARLTDKQADFAGDRIHPSVAGNEKIAVAVLEKLAELGLGENTVPVIRTPGRDIYRNTASIDSMEIFAKILHFFSFIYGFFTGIKSR